MLQNDCVNVAPEHPEWGSIIRATQSVDSSAMSCHCGCFSFHLVRVVADEPLNVMCAGCLSIIHKG